MLSRKKIHNFATAREYQVPLWPFNAGMNK